MSSTVTNSIKIVDILCEFFEVAIHNILYVRKVYPEAIFVRRRKYGIVVYQSVHPQLNEYITECLKSVEFHAKGKQIRKLVVCINAHGTVIERFVFDVLLLQQEIVENVDFLIKLEQNLREFCLKLQASATYLNNLPDNVTFSIQLHTSEMSNLEFNENPVFEDFPWIQINGKQDEIPYADIVPINTIENDNLLLQIYLEKCCKNV